MVIVCQLILVFILMVCISFLCLMLGIIYSLSLQNTTFTIFFGSNNLHGCAGYSLNNVHPCKCSVLIFSTIEILVFADFRGYNFAIVELFLVFL